MTTPNPFLEKRSSLIAGAAITHLAQNVATNQALKNKSVAKYLANSLSQGYHGVVDTSLKSKITRGLSSIITPDVSAAHKAAHEAGGELRTILQNASKRQKAAARMAVEGRFEDIKKYKLADDPIVKSVQTLASKHLPTVKDIANADSQTLRNLWNDKSHPLLSNIAKNIGRGEIPNGSQFKPGSMNQTIPTLSSIAIAPLEPSAAALDITKALAGSKTVQGNKYGKMATDFIQNTFINNPVKKGLNSVSEVKGLGHQASKLLVNPTSAHLKRTSAAITQAAKVS